LWSVAVTRINATSTAMIIKADHILLNAIFESLYACRTQTSYIVNVSIQPITNR
jgi:hypothetical protein